MMDTKRELASLRPFSKHCSLKTAKELLLVEPGLVYNLHLYPIISHMFALISIYDLLLTFRV
jgi:hypothetical protein